MLPVVKEQPAVSSSYTELGGYDYAVDSKKGAKPSLAERNRERQQRFRQRQKSRIEELESRCHKLTSQSRHLAAEKEELSKAVAVLKNLVQVRDLQLVAATSQLAQLLPSSAVKTEPPALEKAGSVESILHQQQPVLAALGAIQKNRSTEISMLQLQSKPENELQEGPSSMDTAAHEPLAAPAYSPASTGQRAHTPQLALEQLCRVAEIAEMQQAESESPVTGSVEATESLSIPVSTSPVSYLDNLSSGFEKKADVLIPVKGGEVAAHSAFLAAHSEHFAAIFEDMQHSQPLHCGVETERDPMIVEAGRSRKPAKDVELFLRFCYGNLDLEAESDAEVLRLMWMADELGAGGLLRRCDSLIASRAAGKRFEVLAEMAGGGDVVDWLRLAERLGLASVRGVCEAHLARHLKGNRSWRENARLQELGQDTLLRVINKLADL